MEGNLNANNNIFQEGGDGLFNHHQVLDDADPIAAFDVNEGGEEGLFAHHQVLDDANAFAYFDVNGPDAIIDVGGHEDLPAVVNENFTCLHCQNPERSFGHRGGFRSHNLFTHRSFTEFCGECFNCFATKTDLEQHFNTTHSQKLRHKKPKKKLKKGGYSSKRK